MRRAMLRKAARQGWQRALADFGRAERGGPFEDPGELSEGRTIHYAEQGAYRAACDVLRGLDGDRVDSDHRPPREVYLGAIVGAIER